MNAIVSADDLGRSHERNLAIDYAMKNGLIYSAGLLVNSLYTDEAIELAKQGGYISRLHCHLSFAYGKMSGFSKPINPIFADCPAFRENGEFKHPFYNKTDFYKYIYMLFRT